MVEDPWPKAYCMAVDSLVFWNITGEVGLVSPFSWGEMRH